MSDLGDRRLGAFLGLVGAVLIALDGFLDLARGIFYVLVSKGGHAFLPFDQALIDLVLAMIVAVFSAIGGLRGENRSLLGGVVLVVVVLFGWLALGLGVGVLSILGALLALVAGVVLLVPRGSTRSIVAETRLLYLTCHRRQPETFSVGAATDGHEVA